MRRIEGCERFIEQCRKVFAALEEAARPSSVTPSEPDDAFR